MLLVSRSLGGVRGAAGPRSGVGHRHQGGTSERKGESSREPGVMGEGGAVLSRLRSELSHGGKFVRVGVVGVYCSSGDGDAEQGLYGGGNLVGGGIAVEADKPELVGAVAGVTEPAGEQASVFGMGRGGALYGDPHWRGGGLVDSDLESRGAEQGRDPVLVEVVEAEPVPLYAQACVEDLAVLGDALDESSQALGEGGDEYAVVGAVVGGDEDVVAVGLSLLEGTEGTGRVD